MTQLTDIGQRAEGTQTVQSDEELDQLSLSDRPIQKRGYTSHLGLAISACIFGSSFQAGFNTGVVNSPSEVIKAFYNETISRRTGSYVELSQLNVLWSITVSIFAVGGMIGGFSAGYFSNRYGRKGALLRNNAVVLLASILLGFSKMGKSYEMIIIGRFLVGLNAGLNTGAAPLYLSEIAPVSVRGLAGTLNQFAITSGVLTSQILGLSKILGTTESWPIVLAFTAVPAFLQLVLLPFCPESPRYLLLHNGDWDGAEKALAWLQGSDDVMDELNEMKNEEEEMRNSKKIGILDLFRTPELRTPIIISLVMQLSQQFSGINAVIYYSTEIFMSADLTEETAQYATVGTASVNVMMTFVSALIMDRAGRRTLHLIGLGGMWAFSTLLALSMIFNDDIGWLKYVSIVSVVMYIVFFATGPGSIPWFFVAELFSQGPRTAAVSLSVLVNWFANFTVGLSYPNLENAIGKYSFVIFVFLLAFFWLYTGIYVPETKGKSIEEITAMFRRKHTRVDVNNDDNSITQPLIS